MKQLKPDFIHNLMKAILGNTYSIDEAVETLFDTITTTAKSKRLNKEKLLDALTGVAYELQDAHYNLVKELKEYFFYEAGLTD